MSKGKWLNKKAKPPNQRMLREARLWAEPHEASNQRTLNQFAADIAYQNLQKDISKLRKIETTYSNIEPDKAPRIPCPICNSKDFLVEGWSHKKILVCEQPTCTYIRAIQNRDKMLSVHHLQIVK
jgi:hypothetical protein